MRAEDFFPLDWDLRPFRRQPYPDMTYREAIDAARVVIWNHDSSSAACDKDCDRVVLELGEVVSNLMNEHDQFPGRSRQSVAALNELWRGKVTTLLKWFQTKGGTK